jgi:hypothetical protein
MIGKWRFCITLDNDILLSIKPSIIVPENTVAASENAKYFRSTSSIGDSVEVVRCTDESQMAERLRSVAKLLPTDGNLLAEHTQMIAERHDAFEDTDGLVKVRSGCSVVDRSTNECFNQPKRAHDEGPFSASNP